MGKDKLKKAALALGKIVLAAALTVFFKAWFGGESLKGLTKLSELGAILTAGVPFWALLIAVVVCVLLFSSWLRTLRNRPELHIAWHGSAGWGWGGMLSPSGMESVLRIQGPVTVSSDNLPEMVTLTAVHLRGAEFAGYFPDFVVKPGATFKHTMHMNFRGPKPESGKPLTI